MGMGPDFSFSSNLDSTVLDFVHRRTSAEEIYFLSNTRNQCEIIDGIFRVKGTVPEIWDPETGIIQQAALFEVNGETTRIPLRLQPYGSVFVVFREGNEAQHLVSAVLDDRQIFPISGEDREAGIFTDVRREGKEISLVAREAGRYILADNTCRKSDLETGNIPAPLEITGEWRIDFPPGWGAPDHIILPELISWTDSDIEGVRYFSGIATYHKKFEIPREHINEGSVICLDLGKVREVVHIRLNREEPGDPLKAVLSD
jgi:hypothetical protein